MDKRNWKDRERMLRCKIHMTPLFTFILFYRTPWMAFNQWAEIVFKIILTQTIWATIIKGGHSSNRTAININGGKSLALTVQCVNMALVQWIKLFLLCFVHVIVPLVVALGDEHVEELLLMNGGWFILPQSGFVQQGKALGCQKLRFAPLLPPVFATLELITTIQHSRMKC